MTSPAETVAEAQKALELDPQHATALGWLAVVHLARGNPQEALAVAQQAQPRDKGWLLGVQLVLAGRVDEARAIAAELEAEPPDQWQAWKHAVLYSALGEKDDAFRWLNYEHIHRWVSWTRVLEGFPTLWDDPRFADLMKKKKLPWQRSD